MSGHISQYPRSCCLITFFLIIASHFITVSAEPCEAVPCVPKSFHGNPESCNTYYKCSKSGSKFRLLSCPTGQRFDSKSLQCKEGEVGCQQPCTTEPNSGAEAKLTEDMSLRVAPIHPENLTSSTSTENKPTDGYTVLDDVKDLLLKADDKNDAEELSSQTNDPSTTPKTSTFKFAEVTKEKLIVTKKATTPMATTSKSSTSTTTTVPTTTPTTVKQTTRTIQTTLKTSTPSIVSTVNKVATSTAKKPISYVPPKPHSSDAPPKVTVTMTLNLTGTERGSSLSGRRMEASTDTTTVPIGIIVGVIAAVLVVIAVVVAVIIVCRKKRQKLSDNEITKIENPQYRGPNPSSGNGSAGPALVVRNYRFSRDCDLYDGSAALNTSTNSITRTEGRSKKRRAPPPPNPFDNDNDDQQPMVEMTTFLEKPPPKPPRVNGRQNSASSGDVQNYSTETDNVNASTSEPLLRQNDGDISARSDQNDNDSNIQPVEADSNVENEEQVEWDEYDRTYNPFAS